MWGAAALLLLTGAAPAPTAAATASWIPKGWERIAEARGDLNGDGRADLAMVVWPVGEAELVHTSTPLRHYRLLIGFAHSGGFRLAVRDDRLLVPPDGMNGGPIDADSVTIRAGTLHLSRWVLRGHEQHHFRWDGHQFRLIGYDLSVSDGRCTYETSMNFLTRRATVVTEGLGETEKARRFKRRITRGPVTLAEAGAEEFYPQMLMAGPDTYCMYEGQKW